SGLAQTDFQILEDKVPQQIDSFTSEESNNLPLYVAVLMDTSPSTAGKLKFEQESAMNFIQTVVRPRKDRVLFATFDDRVTLRQDFTDRLELLDRSFSKIAKELRSQYLITYRPTNDRYDGSYRRVDVKLSNGHENLKLRTKRGYKAVADSVTPK